MKSDPKLPEDAIFPIPPPRPKNVIFEDEEKSKVRQSGSLGVKLLPSRVEARAKCDPCGGDCGRKQHLVSAEYTDPYKHLHSVSTVCDPGLVEELQCFMSFYTS